MGREGITSEAEWGYLVWEFRGWDGRQEMVEGKKEAESSISSDRYFG